MAFAGAALLRCRHAPLAPVDGAPTVLFRPGGRRAWSCSRSASSAAAGSVEGAEELLFFVRDAEGADEVLSSLWWRRSFSGVRVAAVGAWTRHSSRSDSGGFDGGGGVDEALFLSRSAALAASALRRGRGGRHAPLAPTVLFRPGEGGRGHVLAPPAALQRGAGRARKSCSSSSAMWRARMRCSPRSGSGARSLASALQRSGRGRGAPLVPAAVVSTGGGVDEALFLARAIAMAASAAAAAATHAAAPTITPTAPTIPPRSGCSYRSNVFLP